MSFRQAGVALILRRVQVCLTFSYSESFPYSANPTLLLQRPTRPRSFQPPSNMHFASLFTIITAAAVASAAAMPAHKSGYDQRATADPQSSPSSQGAAPASGSAVNKGNVCPEGQYFSCCKAGGILGGSCELPIRTYLGGRS